MILYGCIIIIAIIINDSHKRGDLFQADAHCVSQDLRMSKGIALQFRIRFGMGNLAEQNVGVGGVAVHQGHYYLVTKDKYYNKPTLLTLKSSLEAMKKQAVENDIEKISMPRIGCGLDRLLWNEVEQLLLDIFKNTDINIVVYTL